MANKYSYSFDISDFLGDDTETSVSDKGLFASSKTKPVEETKIDPKKELADMLNAYWLDPKKAKESLKKAESVGYTDDDYLGAWAEVSQQSAEQVALTRQEAGITRSMSPEGVAIRSAIGNPLASNRMPSPAYKPLPAQPPVAVEEEATTGAGLMSPVVKEVKPTPTKDDLISSVFNAEGGYSTDRKDKGNYYKGRFIGTNHGISAPVLAKKLGRTPTVSDMKALTKEDARTIAGEQYYDKFSIDKLPQESREIVFHAIYMGGSRGVRAMQSLLGLKPDGLMGPSTRSAMEKADFTKEEFRDEYLRELEFGTKGYSKPSPTWNEHGEGWTNRYNALAE